MRAHYSGVRRALLALPSLPLIDWRARTDCSGPDGPSSLASRSGSPSRATASRCAAGVELACLFIGGSNLCCLTSPPISMKRRRFCEIGAPGRIRTADHLVRSWKRWLYQAVSRRLILHGHTYISRLLVTFVVSRRYTASHAVCSYIAHTDEVFGGSTICRCQRNRTALPEAEGRRGFSKTTDCPHR